MIHYAVPAAVVAMLAYMFWSVAFRLRRDRVREIKKRDRSHLIFSRRYRIRFLLGRSFKVEEDDPDWQPKLVSHVEGAKADSLPRRER